MKKWLHYRKKLQSSSFMNKTPISKIILEDREFLVKRDDLFDPYLSGNKYRKLHRLLKTPKEHYNKIISYGGTQSNAMLAIAALAKQKGWVFEYYTKPLSKKQKEQEEGNYPIALSLGMQHYELELESYKTYVQALRLNLDPMCIVVDQGGADRMAQEGVAVLAQEIQEESLDFEAIATPSGTGTTTLYLALEFPQYKVYTTAAIGDKAYLVEQMSALAEIPSNLVILEPQKKYHFAKPYKELYESYKLLKSTGIEFDLLYAPLLWKLLMEQTKEKILYIHSGGVSGNVSMEPRYKAKFPELFSL